MKLLTLGISSLLFLINTNVYCQEYHFISFDQLPQQEIFIDTVTNQDCIWNIGTPTKSIFNTAFSLPNVIITDTINSVPPNDTSIFYISHAKSSVDHVFVLRFQFWMDGDTSDIGMIEISPDSGQNWINILNEDTTYDMEWLTLKPLLAGSTNGWQSFDIDMTTWSSAYPGGSDSFPVYFTSDTILFKFTYLTDGINTLKDGWMIDDIYIEDWIGNILESNNSLFYIFPNPAREFIEVNFSTYNNSECEIEFINTFGQSLQTNRLILSHPINIQSLPIGFIYVRCRCEGEEGYFKLVKQ